MPNLSEPSASCAEKDNTATSAPHSPMDPEASSASPETGGLVDSLAAHCTGSLQIAKGSDCPCDESESQQEMSPSSTASLDEFLISALKSRQERLFLLKLDQEFCNFIENPSQAVLEFPWLNSYYRMMIHRSAIYFQLARKVDPLLKRITLSRTENSAIPPLRFCDLVEEEHEEPHFKPVKVLKRCSSRPVSVCETRCSGPGLERRSGSIEQRERAYAEARARIFQEDASEGSGITKASTTESDRVMASTEDPCEMRLIEERTSVLEISTGIAAGKSELLRRTSTSSTASSSGTTVTTGDPASSASSWSGAGHQSPEHGSLLSSSHTTSSSSRASFAVGQQHDIWRGHQGQHSDLRESIESPLEDRYEDVSRLGTASPSPSSSPSHRLSSSAPVECSHQPDFAHPSCLCFHATSTSTNRYSEFRMAPLQCGCPGQPWSHQQPQQPQQQQGWPGRADTSARRYSAPQCQHRHQHQHQHHLGYQQPPACHGHGSPSSCPGLVSRQDRHYHPSHPFSHQLHPHRESSPRCCEYYYFPHQHNNHLHHHHYHHHHQHSHHPHFHQHPSHAERSQPQGPGVMRLQSQGQQDGSALTDSTLTPSQRVFQVSARPYPSSNGYRPYRQGITVPQLPPRHLHSRDQPIRQQQQQQWQQPLQPLQRPRQQQQAHPQESLSQSSPARSSVATFASRPVQPTPELTLPTTRQQPSASPSWRSRVAAMSGREDNLQAVYDVDRRPPQSTELYDPYAD